MQGVHRLATAVAVTSVFSSNLYANDLADLAELVKQQEYQPAYQLAHKIIDANIGDSPYDYLLGRAAFHTEHYQEAVFAFERVVLNEPNHLSARTFLAFSYFKVRNFNAAMAELQKLLDQPMPEGELQQIKTYIQQIEKIKANAGAKQAFSYFLETRMAYDSNVNSGSALDKVVIPVLGEIELFENSKEISDQYQFVRANVGYQYKLNQNETVNLAADISHQQHNKASFLDRTTPTLTANYSKQDQSNHYQVSSYIQPMQLDGDFYRLAYGLIGSVMLPVYQQWLWQGSLGLSQVDNKQSDTLDLEQVTLSNRVMSATSHPHIFEVSYGRDKSALSEANYLSKDNTMARYQYIHNLGQQHKVKFALSYLDSQYQDINPTTGIKRHDKLWSSELGYTYHYATNWSLGLLARHSDKKSNTPLYRYNRSELIFTLSYQPK